MEKPLDATADVDRLTAIGFRSVGEWRRGPKGIEAHLHNCADETEVLYAFVSGSRVLYVGKTTQALKQRIYGYQNPGPTQKTNIRVNPLIQELLAVGGKLEIYALPDTRQLCFGSFQVNLAAGLEDSIVAELQPEWNQAGK